MSAAHGSIPSIVELTAIVQIQVPKYPQKALCRRRICPQVSAIPEKREETGV